MSDPDPLPDLEDLAAYIDGALDAEARQAVEARLAHDQEYYDVLVDSVDSLESLAPPGPRTAPASARPLRRRYGSVPLAAAASILLALLGWSVFFKAAVPPSLDGIDPQRVFEKPLWDAPPWTSERDTTALPEHLSRAQLAFRLGVRTVDLRLATAGRDRFRAGTAAQRLSTLASRLDLRQAGAFDEMADQLRSDRAFDDVVATAPRLEKGLQEGLGRRTESGRAFVLGRWTQATRLAALSENRSAIADLVRQPPSTRAPWDASEMTTLRGVARGTHPFDAAIASLDDLAAAAGG